jgi:HEAT repeat protein
MHPSADVRFAVACALGSFPNDPRVVNTFLALMQDVDDDVRDWAAFGLGVQGDVDSQEIRDALWQRMSDTSRNVREESLVGLGKRRDQRALPALTAELNQTEISDRVIEAAEWFLGEDEHRANWSPSDYAAALKKNFTL